ncbi:MAG TPA: hypothetical protein VI981_03285 [Candidatus Paceibacterota bacterium]
MDYLNRLRYAQSQAGDLTGKAGAEAAYEVAQCLGGCRISGTTIPNEEDGTLDFELALKAAQHARWLTQRIKQRVSQLISSQNEDVESDDEFYESDCRASAVLMRHELWCAMHAIHEADDVLSRANEGKAELTDELTLLIEELTDLDALMIQNIGIFGCVADLPLLTNLKAKVKTESLSELEPLPWWLDGTIEKAAEQAMKKLMEWLPKPSEIERKLRCR